MGARHSGRQAALQMLFAWEASGEEPDRVIAVYWRNFDGDPEGQSYAKELLIGVAADKAKVDEAITLASTHWRIERMSRLDRNLLRLATWELLTRQDIPRAVILDEAVELAKAFGSEDSSAFVNGVLDKIADTLGREDRDR